MATIITRAGKGSPLTNNEVDQNFTNLNNDKLESGDNVSTLVNDAGYATTSYVDTAESDAVSTANAYTDTRETAITTAYQTYADGIVATEATARSTGDSNTLSSAQSYTDTAISNLVDTAPATLDTLNELAAALGDDPNFATTVSNQIGTKLDASHDMTLTLAGDASGSATFTNMGNATLTVAVADDSHNHTIANVDGLQTALDGKVDDSQVLTNVPEGAVFTDTVYTHPSYNGDDFSVDTGALTGATVVSDIDINVTTDGLGHVTDANGVVSTRTLTLADLGFTGDSNANNYTHPTYAGDDINLDTGPLSGATVISDLDFNVTTDTLGHVTDANATYSTRNITYSDVGAAAASHSHDDRYYTETQIDSKLTNGTVTKLNANGTVGDSIEFYQNDGGGNLGIRFNANYNNAVEDGSAWEFQFNNDSTSGDFVIYRDVSISSGGETVTWDEAFRLEGSDTQAYLYGNQVFHDGYHPNADKWTAARTLSLTGDVTGSVSWDGSGNASLTATVGNDSHTHDGRYYTESEADNRFLRKTISAVTATATTTLNFSTADNFKVTLGLNTTLAFSNLVAGQQGVIYLVQDATGGRTFTLPSIAKTPKGGASIAQETGAGVISILSYVVLDTSNVLVNYIGDFA